MHTHAVRTTEDKLATTIDEWLGSGDPAGQADPMPVVLHKGSRDYLVILRHREHDDDAHEQHRAHGTADIPVVVGSYDPDGGVSYRGYVEDEDRTWILYLDRNTRPSVMWMRRAADGGVIGEPVRFDGASVESIPSGELARLIREQGGDEQHPGDRVPADSVPDPADRERYLTWALHERSWFRNELVSARTALQRAGWPDADNPDSTVSRGIEWLRDRQTPRREWRGESGAQTRDVLRVIASEQVSADHQVYVAIDGKNYPVASVETCNAGHGLLIVAPDRVDAEPVEREYVVRREVIDNGAGERLVVEEWRTAPGGGRSGRVLLTTQLQESYSPEELLARVGEAVTAVTEAEVTE